MTDVYQPSADGRPTIRDLCAARAAAALDPTPMPALRRAP